MPSVYLTCLIIIAHCQELWVAHKLLSLYIHTYMHTYVYMYVIWLGQLFIDHYAFYMYKYVHPNNISEKIP